jgi:hypothetical protein
MQNAAVPHKVSARGAGFDAAEGGDAVLSWH